MKRQYYSAGVRGQNTRSRDAGAGRLAEAGASTAIVVTRASGVARPIVPAVNTRYPPCVSTGAPTAVTGDQNESLIGESIGIKMMIRFWLFPFILTSYPQTILAHKKYANGDTELLFPNLNQK